MSIALQLLKRFWPYGVAVMAALLVVAGLYALHAHGVSEGKTIANTEWQSRWDKRDAADAEATAQYQAEQRALEQSRQYAIEQVKTDAQSKIDQVTADADAAALAADSLQQAADRLATRLADSQARVSACVTDASKAAAENARVLADVLKRADKRAGHLAGVADQAMTRGLACEASYDAIYREVR